jgi:hypothetical protein
VPNLPLDRIRQFRHSCRTEILLPRPDSVGVLGRLRRRQAARAMHAAQVGSGFGSPRSARVKCCHEKRCLVTIARSPSAPRKSGTGQRAEKSMIKGCGEIRKATHVSHLGNVPSSWLKLPGRYCSRVSEGARAPAVRQICRTMRGPRLNLRACR